MGGSDSESSGGGGSRARGLVLKALFLFGGALLLKRLSKSTTRWDHARVVAETLSGQKFSREQASRDPDNYFNLRMLVCPATEMVDGSRVLYFEQAFWRTPSKPYRQRFYMVKPCPKEMKRDVELSSYAIRDAEEYKNFCDRPKDQRPQAEEVIGGVFGGFAIAFARGDVPFNKDFLLSTFAEHTKDIAEHLTTIHLSRCERGKRCLYEGSTPAGGFPNSWNGATYSTSELTIHRNEVHTWERGFDDRDNQVWGAKGGPYEFKPAPKSSYDDMFTPLGIPPPFLLEKKIEGSFVLDE